MGDEQETQHVGGDSRGRFHHTKVEAYKNKNIQGQPYCTKSGCNPLPTML